MCGFVGFSNFKKDISKENYILEQMNNTLSKRGPDEKGYYTNKHSALGHKRLIIIDPEGRKTTNDRNIFLWRICNLL